jgi:hypothetical protein
MGSYDPKNQFQKFVVFFTIAKHVSNYFYSFIIFNDVHVIQWECFQFINIHVAQCKIMICILCNSCVGTSLLEECKDDTHTLEMGTWESFGTPKTSEFDCRGQNTSPWGVLHAIWKLLECRCQKWPCMSHLDICSTSCSKKKGR